MKTLDPAIPASIPPDVQADLEDIARQAFAPGKPDPILVQRIRDHAAIARAELQAGMGIQDIGVAIIRRESSSVMRPSTSRR